MFHKDIKFYVEIEGMSINLFHVHHSLVFLVVKVLTVSEFYILMLWTDIKWLDSYWFGVWEDDAMWLFGRHIISHRLESIIDLLIGFEDMCCYGYTIQTEIK